MDRKESRFTKVLSLQDSDYVRAFGQSSNIAISKPDLFKQIKDETQIFIYPTIDQLQSANLVADPDWPVYVRVEETNYALYKITSLAPIFGDISLNNGSTATLQLEDRRFFVDTVADLANTAAEPDQVVYLKEYNPGTFKGGGHLIAKAGAITPNNVTTFASATFGVYFERINTLLFAEHAGALGDGATNDSSRLIAMHNAVGYIRLSLSTYAGGLTFSATDIRIYGSGKPTVNGGLNGFIAGSGSIIKGTIFLRAERFHLYDFAGDVGDTTGLGAIEGIVADAPVAGTGIYSDIKNIASMGVTGATSSHGLLHEGFNKHSIKDVDIYNHNFGVVSKSRNGVISNITGTNVKTAAVYAKSSLSAAAGNVASGLADNITIDNVVATSSFSESCAVWAHAEGLDVTRINVNNFSHTGGRAALRVTTDGAQVAGYVNVSNGTASDNFIGYELNGNAYECSFENVKIINPASGESFYFTTGTRNWRVNGAETAITSGGIVSTNYATFSGTGQWDHINVRNNNVDMIITHSLVDVKAGTKTGRLTFSGEGNVNLLNGAIAAAGEIVPQVQIRTGNMIHFTGMVNPSAASSANIVSIGGGLSFGFNKYFTLLARTTGGVYTTAYVVCSGANLTVVSPAVSTLNQIDLSGITVAR